MATNMEVTEGIEIIYSFGTCKWELDSNGGIQVLSKKKKLVYIGDLHNIWDDMGPDVTKKQFNTAKANSLNWREDPDVLKLLGLRDGYIEMGSWGFIEPNDSILEIETLYSYGSELVRSGYLTTKRDLINRVLEANGVFEL